MLATILDHWITLCLHSMLAKAADAEQRGEEPAQPHEPSSRSMCPARKKVRPVRGAWTGRKRTRCVGSGSGYAGCLLAMRRIHGNHRMVMFASLHPPPA